MKNNTRFKKFILSSILIFSCCTVLQGEITEYVFDENFFRNFSAKPVIQRDDILENVVNSIIIGRGRITNISVTERYKKKYRVIIESSDSMELNQKIFYYVFLDNKDTADLLSVDSKFEFKGQLMGYTPLGTKRNDYILDVIFMDGSTLIE